MKNQILRDKIHEALVSVLPVSAVVLILSLTVTPLSLSTFLSFLFGTVFLVVFLVLAVLIVVFNIFSLGRIHKLAKSVYQSGGTERSALKHVKAAKNWLIVLAVFAILSGLGNLGGTTLLPGLASLTDGAAMILSAILIGKYLEER